MRHVAQRYTIARGNQVAGGRHRRSSRCSAYLDSIAAFGLGQLDAAGKGIHLFWLGAPAFLFAPGGWIVERRVAARPDVPSSCDIFNQNSLAQLRKVREVRATLGVWTWREGFWPGDGGTKAEVLTLELDGEGRGVHGRISARTAFVIAYLRDKAAAFAGPLTGAFDLGTSALDRVVIHAVAPSGVHVCVRGDDSAQWDGATKIATLQVPIRELMPSLATPQAELAEAQSRLLPGESFDEERFRDYAEMLRTALPESSTSPRQRILLMRDDAGEPFEELSAFDPIRLLYADPMWRRVLGLAFFDRDPALVPGTHYDYRVTGRFPVAEVTSRWYGFHTIPAGTALPAEFYLHDCMLRLAQPTVVRRSPEIDESGSLLTSRRGIALAARDATGWFGLGIEDASLVIDFGNPSKVIVLDIALGHTLRYQAGDAWSSFAAATPVPPGPRAVLTFAAPVTQLRLFGHGFVFGFRFADAFVADAEGMVALIATVLNVPFADAPRPDPPTALAARNLQVPNVATAPGPRHQIGIALEWTPAPVRGLPFWPANAGAVPLDATVFQLERRIEPAGAWTPVLGLRNRLLGGSSADAAADPAVRPGTDLLQVFPEEGAPGASSNTKRYQDVFLLGDGSGQRAPPPLGGMLAYRVRALDVVGRPSDTWTVASPVRLEKHEAPPLPAAPAEIPADELVKPAPTGVTARAIVRGDPSLTAADQMLLGDSSNVIVLRWGWHARERKLDPHANQFRIYIARPLDGMDGQIGSVTDVPAQSGAYVVSITLERPVKADAAKGLYLDAGSPFFIETHTAGTAIQATVRTRIPQGPGGGFRKPAVGKLRLPLRLTAELTRPSGWAERVEVRPGQRFMPITNATAYELVLRDRLQLDDAHPRDSLWLGVTAADSESYVADTFPQPPGGALPGNESAVAFAQCQSQLMTCPAFTPPHALAPVARLATPEPVDGSLRFTLDLAPYLGGTGLAAGNLIKPERLSVTDLLAACRTENGRAFALVVDRRSPGEAEHEITLPNPGDHALLVAGLEAGDAASIDDRIAVYLAGVHPYADRLFTDATPAPVAFALFAETLHAGGARYVYRVRKANAAGRASARGEIAKVIVRVPSLMPSAPPQREPREAGDALGLLRLAVPRDSRVREVLIFKRIATGVTKLGGAQVVRIANRSDLDAAAAIRLRTVDGEMIAPQNIAFDEALSDPRTLRARSTLQGNVIRSHAVWACSVTEDGIPSTLAGPWVLRLPTA